MKRLSCAALGLILTAGCGTKLGDPQAPTSSQMQAQVQLTSTIDQIGALGTKADSAFSLYGVMAGVGPTAVDMNAKKSSSLGGDGLLTTQDLPPGCYTGDGKTGFTYNNCSSGGSTINGSVKISGQTTTIDLTISAASSGTNTKITLQGSVTNTGTHISGTLTYAVSVDLGIGNIPGANAGNLKTTVTYDIGYTSSPSCIDSGTLRVDLDDAGYSGSAQFEWTGCNVYKVRNG